MTREPIKARTESDALTHLVQTIDPAATLVDYWPLAGGVSAQTSALEIQQANGTRQRLVLHAHGPRDVARDPDIALHEFQLLQALRESGLPVPKPIFVASAGEILTSPAVVVEFVDGEIITDPVSPARFIADLAYWLARIHEFDLTSHDLTFLVANDYHATDRFQPRSNDSDLVLEMCNVLGRIQSVDFRNPEVLLHGDYWRGNLLWKDDQLAAILDWEDAMIGDPIIDLARSRLEIHWTHGEMARERFTSHYLSYRDINVDTLAFWDMAMALGFARAYPEWGLSPEREQELHQAMERFVQHAMQQLWIDRS